VHQAQTAIYINGRLTECRATYMVSARTDANQLSMGQVETAEKANKISAITPTEHRRKEGSKRDLKGATHEKRWKHPCKSIA